MGKPETSAVVQLTEAYFRAAKEAGCPQDQIVNFYKAGIVLQPKQLEMSSAARKCDNRCAECEAKYKAGHDLPDSCDKCGPTAVGVGGARGGGKQIKVSQTMHVWRDGKFLVLRAGDIQQGDFLIGSNGSPAKVLRKSIPETRQFYKLTFDDGSEIEAGDEHLWTVFDLSKRAPGHRERGWFKTTVSTEWLSKQSLKYRTQHRFAIPVMSEPVEPTNPDEPELPPYTLGYWLGNGFRQGSYVSCHIDDANEIAGYLGAELGYDNIMIRHYEKEKNGVNIHTRGWIQRLRAVNWPSRVTKTKSRKARTDFIDDRLCIEWRNWSSRNRRLLLAGLLDSDGTVKDSSAAFDSKDLSLVMLVRNLMQSLGMKPYRIIQKKPRKAHWSMMYRVACSPSEQVFRLRRKAEKLKTSGRQLRESRRYITAIEKTTFEAGVCFQVDSEDHLYAVGDEYILTHNSQWMFAQVACDDCQRFGGLKVLLLRKTAKSLREQIRDLIQKTLKNIRHNYREQFGELEFPNGSYIKIGHFKDEREIENYLGQEYDIIAIEELTTLTFDKYKNIISCLRSSKQNWRPRLYASWNWGGIGHHFCKEVFYRPFKEKRERETKYILATVADNKHVNPEYKKVLQSYTGWKYQSWFLGDPDFVAGQFFTNYKPDIHVFPNQSVTFDVSKVVRWFGSLDYGFKHPNCFLLHCQDSDGNYFTMREYHKAETLIQDHAEEFRDMLRLQNLDVDDLEFIAAGRDCFKVDKDGSTVATEYSKCGIELTPVHIDRVNAWSQCQERLGDVERGIRPTWYIHKSCENLISQIQVAEADEKKPGDVKKMDADEEGLGGDDALECCTGKTRVIVSGGEKPISEIKTGEKVLTRKGYRSVVRTITTANQKVFTVKFDDGPSLEATANHPILIKTGDSDQWVKIQDLKVGMIGKGFSEDGYYCAMKIESIRESGIADVYNLTVEDCPEYFANGILVHNCWRNSVVMERTSAVTDAKSVKTYRGITDIAATVVDQDDAQRLIPEWSEA